MPFRLLDGFRKIFEGQAEIKIVATAMIKQIDRVINDLKNQAFQFKNRNPSAITIAIVGVNHAPRYSSYEGERVFVVEGARSPAAEASKAIPRLDAGRETTMMSS